MTDQYAPAGTAPGAQDPAAGQSRPQYGSEVERIIGRGLDDLDKNAPPTLDLDQPTPTDVGAAVRLLWELARRQRDELARLRARVDALER